MGETRNGRGKVGVTRERERERDGTSYDEAGRAGGKGPHGRPMGRRRRRWDRREYSARDARQ